MIIFNINNNIITKSTLSTTHKIKFYIYIPKAITVYFEKKERKRKTSHLFVLSAAATYHVIGLLPLWRFFSFICISLFLLTTQPPRGRHTYKSRIMFISSILLAQARIYCYYATINSYINNRWAARFRTFIYFTYEYARPASVFNAYFVYKHFFLIHF